jgi:hypothetical protein
VEQIFQSEYVVFMRTHPCGQPLYRWRCRRLVDDLSELHRDAIADELLAMNRHPRHRSVDRAGRTTHCAAARRRGCLPGDLALRKTIQRAYQLDHLPNQQEVVAIAKHWRPYRSLATSSLFALAYDDTGPSP